jgi:rubredoxin
MCNVKYWRCRSCGAHDHRLAPIYGFGCARNRDQSRFLGEPCGHEEFIGWLEAPRLCPECEAKEAREAEERRRREELRRI